MDEKSRELIAGYALDILDEDEKAEALRLLETSSEARALQTELQEVTGQLGLLVPPADLPSGSLGRLRQKAGIAAPTPVSFQQATERRKNRANLGWGFSAASAAAVAFLVAAVVFGLLLLNTRGDLDNAQKYNQQVAAILSSPDLRVTDLKPTGANPGGGVRLYSDPSTDKAVLVAQNLPALPSDKEYEAWLIDGNNKAQRATMLGVGGTTVAQSFSATGDIESYKLVAVTVEKKGGADQPTSNPILAGTIS
jgi:anti-sigma-K factor RskA